MLGNFLVDEPLRGHPVFQYKLLAFKGDYSVGERPCFLWQARPTSEHDFDVDSEDLRAAFKEGSPGNITDNWWYSFQSSWVKTVFDGITMQSFHDGDPGWAIELHTDGHLIAGLWRFPEVNNSGPLILDMHKKAFEDFGACLANLYQKMGINSEVLVTCTLLNSNKTSFMKSQNFDRRVKKLSREHLQWRIRKIGSPAEAPEVMSKMANELFRAFG